MMSRLSKHSQLLEWVAKEPELIHLYHLLLNEYLPLEKILRNQNKQGY